MLVGLDLAEPMMFFTLHITCSCIFMHTYLSVYFYIFELFGAFSNCLFLPPLSLVYVSASMAPKRKSAPSQNLLRFRASSSSDATPSSVWFCDEDARKDFSENFSQRDVHSKYRVILLDFSNTDLPIVIHCRGW